MSAVACLDCVAQDWDAMRREFFSSRIRDFAIGVAGIRPGCLAADIGAGTGFMAEGLVAAGSRVIAVDPCGNMLAQLARRFEHLKTVETRRMAEDRLPIEDQQVDVVFANMLLHHTEAPARSILEMKRILKPGGRLVITDLDKHEALFLKTEHRDRWRGFYRSDIRHWLLTSGFSNIIVNAIPGERCCAEAPCGGFRVAPGIFMATGTA